jgi:ABC-2 type transport system permease protein
MLFLRRVLAVARAEGQYLLREPRTLLVIFVQPMMLLILYGYAISFDLHDLPFAVLDQDGSDMSRRFAQALDAGGEGRILAQQGYLKGPEEIAPLLANSRVRFVLVIPPGFAREAAAGKRPQVQAVFDASDSNTAGVAAGYLATMVAAQNAELAAGTLAQRGQAFPEGPPGAGGELVAEPLNIRWRILYNPDLSSRRFIIPGLIAILLSNIAGTLTATTIVRERELGSLESLLTAPVGALDLVLGKMAPYVLVAAGDVVLVLVAGGLVFGVWPQGNLLTLASFSLLFLMAMLAMGTLISATSPNQLLALITALLVTMLPNFFLTGFAFPRSNMPWILRVISEPLPATQYLTALRGVFLKGVGWAELWPQGLWMGATAVALLLAAIRSTAVSLARGLD